MKDRDEVNYLDVFNIVEALDSSSRTACVKRFVEGGYHEVDLDAYQIATRMWVGEGYDFTQSALKLVGEMGEVVASSTYEGRMKEVGDVLWYLARIADYLQVRLSRFTQFTPATLLFGAVGGTTLDATVFVAASQISELAGKFRMHRRAMSREDEDTIAMACVLIMHWLQVKFPDATLNRAAAANLHKLWTRHGASAPNYTLPVQ